MCKSCKPDVVGPKVCCPVTFREEAMAKKNKVRYTIHNYIKTNINTYQLIHIVQLVSSHYSKARLHCCNVNIFS